MPAKGILSTVCTRKPERQILLTEYVMRARKSLAPLKGTARTRRLFKITATHSCRPLCLALCAIDMFTSPPATWTVATEEGCERLHMESNDLIIQPPIYLIGMAVRCWQCQSKMSAVTILAPYVKDTEKQVCILTEIENMPNEVVQYIQSRVPTYKLKYSKTLGQKYFANTCPKCGILSGDFYLHSEHGAPFSPVVRNGR